MSYNPNKASTQNMDETTKKVRDMYTRFSYPGLGEGESERDKTVSLFLSALQKYHLQWEGKKILDVGCGTGYTTASLAKQLPECHVTGIDISPGSLKVAAQYQARFQLTNVEWIELDITKQPLPGKTYIFILSSGSLHHMSEPEQALKHIYDALQPGGLFGLSVYSHYNNFQRYRMRDALDCLVPDRSDIETRNAIARELWEEARALPDQELADSLSHPCDRAYTFRAIHDLCSEVGFEFLEWCNCAVGQFAKKGKVMGERYRQLDRLQQYELIEQLVQTKMINLFFRRGGNQS